MTKFTVLLLYPDYLQSNGDDTYQAWVEADTVQEAKEKAQHDVWSSVGEAGSWEDFSVLAVYEGHHLEDVKARVDPPYRCKFCGARSFIEPSDQAPPPSYCHPGDHGTPDNL